MKIPPSDLYKGQNARLIPNTKKKAVIVNFNANATLADIYFLDNPQTIMKNVSVSNNAQVILRASTLTNVRCVVDIFDESNAGQIIIAYTY